MIYRLEAEKLYDLLWPSAANIMATNPDADQSMAIIGETLRQLAAVECERCVTILREYDVHPDDLDLIDDLVKQLRKRPE